MNSLKNIHITFLGDGSWGTTLACLLGTKGYNVNIWVFEEEVAKDINENKHFQCFFEYY